MAERAKDISPLLISEKVPSVEITSVNGKSESLTDIVQRKLSVVIFYRGGWCPYCNAHLAEVGQAETEIKGLGYQIIAVGPDSPEKLKATVKQGKLNYALYSDSNGALMKAMGIAFQAPEKDREKLSNYSEDQNPGLLPVPSLFVVDTDATILFEYISPNYRQRISADLLLEVLKQLNKEKK